MTTEVAGMALRCERGGGDAVERQSAAGLSPAVPV
jgi:hypothetical protein